MKEVKLQARVAAHLEELRKTVLDAKRDYDQCAYVAILGEGVDMRDLPPTTKVNIAPDGVVTFIETAKPA